MKRLPEELLRRMGERLARDDRDEMAIPSYLHRNPALRWMAWRRVEVVAARLQRLLRARPGAQVLDFGCGTGVLFQTALDAGAKVTGVDLALAAAELLVQERALAGVTLVSAADAEAKIGAGSVEVIVAAEVLEHIEPLGPTLQSFARWLAPGGRLLVSLPTESGLYRLGRRLAGFSGHYHHHGAAEIDEEIRAAGWHRRHLGTVPAPGPLAIYWVAEYERA